MLKANPLSTPILLMVVLPIRTGSIVKPEVAVYPIAPPTSTFSSCAKAATLNIARNTHSNDALRATVLNISFFIYSPFCSCLHSDIPTASEILCMEVSHRHLHTLTGLAIKVYLAFVFRVSACQVALRPTDIGAKLVPAQSSTPQGAG